MQIIRSNARHVTEHMTEYVTGESSALNEKKRMIRITDLLFQEKLITLEEKTRFASLVHGCDHP